MPPIPETKKRLRSSHGSASVQKRARLETRVVPRTEQENAAGSLTFTLSSPDASSDSTAPSVGGPFSSGSFTNSSAGSSQNSTSDANVNSAEATHGGNGGDNTVASDNGQSANNGSGQGEALSDSEIRQVIAEIFNDPDGYFPDPNASAADLLAGIPSFATAEEIDALLNSLPPTADEPEDALLQSGNFKLPKIGQFQLVKLLDESSQTYDALDLSSGALVTARRLDFTKHMRRLRLARRLSYRIEYLQDDQRIYELLFPKKTTYILHKEKAEDGQETLHYYWFEPPHYGSLHAFVIERKRLPEMQSKEYFRQICDIVEFCHRRGVVIRDLKLRKFVFADARRSIVKLDDLDETAICPENKAQSDSADADVFDPDDDMLCDRHGCPAYVSPEILDLSKKYYSGKAADVWSLGVLLYVLLVGKYPFYDVTPAGLFTKIRQARFQLSDQDGVPFDARVLIKGLLRRDPKDRPSILEILAYPWVKPRDYRSAFKVFDIQNCVFWKLPGPQ